MHVDVVIGWEILKQSNVRYQSSATLYPLKKVMAEQCIIGYTMGKATLKGRHFIDAFTSVDPLPKEVLVHV